MCSKQELLSMSMVEKNCRIKESVSRVSVAQNNRASIN